MNKFITCRLRVIYSNGSIVTETFVPVKEASKKEDRITAIKTITDAKKILYYYLEDKYENRIGRFGEVLFNNRHARINSLQEVTL